MSLSPEELVVQESLREVGDLLAGLGEGGIVSVSHRQTEVLGKLPPISKKDEDAGLGSNKHRGGGGGCDAYVKDIRAAYKKATAVEESATTE